MGLGGEAVDLHDVAAVHSGHSIDLDSNHLDIPDDPRSSRHLAGMGCLHQRCSSFYI